MEIVCGSRTVHNLHVGFFKQILVVIVNPVVRNFIILITKLQESLNS